MHWRDYGYQRPAEETSAPYRLDTPLSFVSRHPCVWYAGHGHGDVTQTSKHSAAGGNYPAHNRPVFGRSLVSILRSREIPFPGSRKKINNRDSQVSLIFLFEILKWLGHVDAVCSFVCSVIDCNGSETKKNLMKTALNNSSTRYAHTHNCLMARDYPGGPVPEETFTYSHPS